MRGRFFHVRWLNWYVQASISDRAFYIGGAMDKMTFHEMLKHPKWQKKRLEILERENYTCQGCGDNERQLHVHHGYYDSNLKLWEYDNDTLWCYCDLCHTGEHESLMKMKKELARHDIQFLDACGMIDYFGFFINLALTLDIYSNGLCSEKSKYINDNLLKAYLAYKSKKDG